MLKFSAEDIANQTFESRFRGYDRNQVDEFLNVLSREFEHIATEFKQARQELDTQRQELREYRQRERSLHDALNMAKQVGEDIKQQAERDADLTVADAELKAERILSGVQSRVSELRGEMVDLQQRRVRCETELRNVLESHLKMLDMLSTPEQSEQRSAISRAPTPPEAAPNAQAAPGENPSGGDVVHVGDSDIESSEAIDEPGSTTSTGMANA